MVRIKVKLDEEAKELYKKHPEDAGWDLYATERTFNIIKQKDGIEGIDYIHYGTGVHVEIPKGYVGLIFPRSSVYKYDLDLSNCVGVIDSGYTGEIMFKFKQRTFDGLSYEVGDRIGQIIFMKLPDVELEYVDSLEETARGKGGFGSTGA